MFCYNPNWQKNTGTCRAGVIPYTIKDNRLYFLLGIDRRTRELTDFGGGAKLEETMSEAALRELHEESCEIFKDHITVEQLSTSPVVMNQCKTAIIFFIKIDPLWLLCAEKRFKENQYRLHSISKYLELIGIKWVEENHFKEIAFNRKKQCMWRRIQNIVRTNTTWHELRVALLLGPELHNIIKKSLLVESAKRKLHYDHSHLHMHTHPHSHFHIGSRNWKGAPLL